MAHIPVVPVRLGAEGGYPDGPDRIGRKISVGGGVDVIRMEHVIGVIGMPGVGVVIEIGIAMHVGVIAMIVVGVCMTVEMRRGVRMVAM